MSTINEILLNVIPSEVIKNVLQFACLFSEQQFKNQKSKLKPERICLFVDYTAFNLITLHREKPYFYNWEMYIKRELRYGLSKSTIEDYGIRYYKTNPRRSRNNFIKTFYPFMFYNNLGFYNLNI